MLFRSTAVLLIVVFHATYFLGQYGDLVAPHWIAQVNTVLTPLRIPLLVLLSGMLLGASLRKGAGRYFSGKARNVAWPYLVWAVIWGALSWPVYSLAGYALGGSYLWFLLFLLSYYCLAWFLRAVPPEPVIAVALVASVLAPDGSMYPERWLYLFALFMAGHLLTVRPAVRRWLFTSGWALVLAAVLLAVHLGFSLGYAYGLGSSLFMAAGAIVLIRLALRFGSTRVLRPLRFVGRHSLVFYAAHYPLLAGITIGASAAGVSTAAVLLPVLVVAAVVTCTALALGRHRAPVSWLFTAPQLRRVMPG